MQLIVWDFDGTLADSRALIVAGMEHALKGLGLQERPELRQEWLRCVGLPLEEGLQRTFAPLGLDPVDVLKVYRTFDWNHALKFAQKAGGLSDNIWGVTKQAAE